MVIIGFSGRDVSEALKVKEEAVKESVKVEQEVKSVVKKNTSKVSIVSSQSVSIPSVISLTANESVVLDRDEFIQMSNKSVLLRTLMNNHIVIVKKI